MNGEERPSVICSTPYPSVASKNSLVSPLSPFSDKMRWENPLRGAFNIWRVMSEGCLGHGKGKAADFSKEKGKGRRSLYATAVVECSERSVKMLGMTPSAPNATMASWQAPGPILSGECWGFWNLFVVCRCL